MCARLKNTQGFCCVQWGITKLFSFVCVIVFQLNLLIFRKNIKLSFTITSFCNWRKAWGVLSLAWNKSRSLWSYIKSKQYRRYQCTVKHSKQRYSTSTDNRDRKAAFITRLLLWQGLVVRRYNDINSNLCQSPCLCSKDHKIKYFTQI